MNLFRKHFQHRAESRVDAFAKQLFVVFRSPLGASSRVAFSRRQKVNAVCFKQMLPLANYVGEWSAQFQIPADFTAGRFGKNRLAADAETHLYRIAQEALNNVYKHAQARGVDVALERRDGFAVLIVEDDGIGFAPDKVSGKKNQKRIGLAGMKERAALVGGKVEIESAPGKGTTVFARVPVADSDKPIKIKKKKDE